MRFRFWMLIALALMLAALAGCANAPGGGRGGATVTPGPIKTLRPTFTPTPAKPKPPVTPGGATQAPASAGQAQAATVTPQASPTPEPSPTPVPSSPTPEKAGMTVSSPGATNVRSGPGTTFAKIGEVQQGQSFEITGKNQVGTWWQFSFNGQPGWISGDMVSANAAAENVQVVASIPAVPVQPTAAPRPAQPPPAPVQPTAAPPPPAAIFSQGGAEFRNADSSNFNVVTFWGRLGPTGSDPISGGYKMKVSSPFGSGEVPFGGGWQNADPGLPSQFRYNAKVEAPRAAGAYRAVVVDGSGKEVSDPITGALLDNTHDVILSWFPR
jgi:uncharacterized protein YraI